MRAILVEHFGGAEAMRAGELEIPEPARDELLVRVLAAGVGPWDVEQRRGCKGPLPYVPGAQFAGRVVGDTGADAGFEDGASVYGWPGPGGCYAQYVTCHVERLAPVPAGLRFTDAAAVPVDALTADQGITGILAVKAADRVMITAAAGGLGHFAVQSGSRLIRMAPRFDDGTLTVHVPAMYYWLDAAQAHRAVERGIPGEVVLIVDDDLAAALEV